jgi:5,10-methenyltetrahydromethanopterin hydrogenase
VVSDMTLDSFNFNERLNAHLANVPEEIATQVKDRWRDT